MSSPIILLAETGSDIPASMAFTHGIPLVPMHVSMGNQTLDDGAFPPEDVCAYYDKTGKVPTTSGSTLYDFEQVYENIFAQDPNARVLYLAYSAVTTCSFHSSTLALEGKLYAKNVRAVDTKHVSVGQCAVVLATKKWLEAHPDATLEEAAQAAEAIGKRIQMSFIPKNLDYLRQCRRSGRQPVESASLHRYSGRQTDRRKEIPRCHGEGHSFPDPGFCAKA